MVLKLEQVLGSKNGITVLRYLVLRPYLRLGLTELSEIVGVSKSNVLRVLAPLKKERLIIEQKSDRKKLIQINSEHEFVKQLWKMFMLEKKMFLPADFKNIIDLFFNKIKGKVDAFVVFGSVAQGLATSESDIDILVVGDKKVSGPILTYLPFRFEVHNYSWGDLKEKKDFVVLEALMNSIVYQGQVFDLIKELKSFPKSYLLYRLQKAKTFYIKAKKGKGESSNYFRRLADVALGEIGSLLNEKELKPKKLLKKATLKKIKELEEAIAKEGDKIWLI